MNLKQYYLTENACYKQNKKHTVKGIMVHSTGANNPFLSRVVAPDDGILGPNKYNNHWNQYKPEGRFVCPHAVIGWDKNRDVRTYQLLPWDIMGWHSGSGALGESKNANNNGYIGFEICEDDLTDKNYFLSVYNEAVDLCVYLCRLYKLTEKNIICHCEGFKLGIASNHADVMHWFPKFGKSMDTFRADVHAKLSPSTIVKPVVKPAIPPVKPVTPTPPTKPVVDKTIDVGDVVKFKADATRYYPKGSLIPTWAKNTYYHIVKQTLLNGKKVNKGGAECVLLLEKALIKNGLVEPGIGTWVDKNCLEIVNNFSPWYAKENELVEFIGTVNYLSANSTMPRVCKKGLAKLLSIHLPGQSRHPYKIYKANGSTSNVNGWVNGDAFTRA